MKLSLRSIVYLSFYMAFSSIALGGSRDLKGIKNGTDMERQISTRGAHALFNINTISAYIRNNGSFNRQPVTGDAGFEWPKGTGNTAIYASGLWIAGLHHDSVAAAIAEYSYEYDAGKIGADVNPDDPKWRVYLIRRGDAVGTNPDYADWPFNDGAPALRNAAGTADSLDQYGNRIPGLTGDMTAWTVFNDSNPDLHTNMRTSPLGVEVQMTAFGFVANNPLNNSIIYKWKILNRGIDSIKDCYISIWADADIGSINDDYDGCDSTLALGYSYNANPTDGVYGGSPPAVGFTLLQGPIIKGEITDTVKLPDGRIFPGCKILKMTSFVKYNNDASDMGNPNTGSEAYNFMRGLTRTGAPITDPWGNVSKLMFPGEPYLQYSSPQNWIETENPGDRRFLMSAGPFTLAPGDSQEVVAANIIVNGNNNLESVYSLENCAQYVRNEYANNFARQQPDPIVRVDISNPLLFADNLNDDKVVNPGENIRYGFTITNDSYDTLTLDIRSGNRWLRRGPFLPGASLNMKFGYNYLDSGSYFDTNVSPIYTDSVITIPILIATVVSEPPFYTWNSEITFPVSQLPSPLRGTPLYHTAGNTDWRLNVLVVDQTKIEDHEYEISFDDSSDGSYMTLKDNTLGTSLFSKHPLPDQYGHNMPLTDGFKILRGNNFGLFGIRNDSTGWRSSYPQWFQGYRFDGGPPSGFNGGVTYGSDLPNYLAHLNPVLPPQNHHAVEVRFDSSNPQKAYRLRRVGGLTSAYVIQAVNPFIDLPFTVWDIYSSPPRQLTVAWRDNDNSSTYNPPVYDDGLEIIYIYNRSYDPAGHQWLYEGESSDAADYSDKCTIGPEADIMYGISLGVIYGSLLNENPGTLYIRPWYYLASEDKFLFNPTQTVGVAEGQSRYEYRLEQNYPNPFNSRTIISFKVPALSRVSLKVFNLLGQEVASLIDGQVQPGGYDLQWDASHLSSGVYFYRMESIPAQKVGHPFVEIRKLLHIK